MRVVHVVSNLSAEAGVVARAVMDAGYAMARDGEDQMEIVTYRGGTYDFSSGDLVGLMGWVQAAFSEFKNAMCISGGTELSTWRCVQVC